MVAAAGDLYGSAEVNAANAAFDAVGIGQGAAARQTFAEYALHFNERVWLQHGALYG